MADPISATSRGPDLYSARVQRSSLAAAAPNVSTLPGSLASNLQLQEILQKRRFSSELLSTLMTSDGRFLRPAQIPPTTQSASSTMIQGTAQSSWATHGSRQSPGVSASILQPAEGRRIAAEAFLIEARAQRQFELQQAQGIAARRQWMA